jgi:peptidoglycan/xylan/chitin deacetylase (PgdA/CDA1 family)
VNRFHELQTVPQSESALRILLGSSSILGRKPAPSSMRKRLAPMKPGRMTNTPAVSVSCTRRALAASLARDTRDSRASGACSDVDILMYHSIAEGDEPICIKPSLFREQIREMADQGHYAVSLADYWAWRQGQKQLAPGFVVVTFDDGYRDFATTAFPEMQARGWNCTLFLPTGKIGGLKDWGRSKVLDKRLLSWREVAELAAAGVELGAHGVTHADLTSLAALAAHGEIIASKRAIEERVGCQVTSFAFPYGTSNRGLRSAVSQHYELAVGVTFRRATPHSDPFYLPRIDMRYFGRLSGWPEYLKRPTTWRLTCLRVLRGIRVLSRKHLIVR